MANVLPPSAQKRIWAVYRARFIIAFSLALIALALLFALTLIPSYLALSLAAPPAQEVGASHGSPDDSTALARTQALVAGLSPVISATTSPMDIVASALAERPQGVLIDHILYTAASGLQQGQVVLGGKSTPASIAAYRDVLQKDPHFTAVSVPVEALVGSESGTFSITLTGNF